MIKVNEVLELISYLEKCSRPYSTSTEDLLNPYTYYKELMEHLYKFKHDASVTNYDELNLQFIELNLDKLSNLELETAIFKMLRAERFHAGAIATSISSGFLMKILVKLRDKLSINDNCQSTQDDQATDYSIQVQTQYLIDKFLQDKDLSIGGPIFDSKSLKMIKNKKDLASIGSSQQGCYFIFSTLAETEIPSISVDGYKAYDKFIEKDGRKFRCLYNGKGQHIKERLQLHLFNPHTLRKVLSDDFKAKTISGTGAMSLETITQEQAHDLEQAGQFIPSKHKLKPVQKALHCDSHLKLEDQQFFLNGIDITEEQWLNHKFAVVVIKTDSEFGKILIEEAFAFKNGRPPLCRRHG